jgi:hypothetical protein
MPTTSLANLPLHSYRSLIRTVTAVVSPNGIPIVDKRTLGLAQAACGWSRRVSASPFCGFDLLGSCRSAADPQEPTALKILRKCALRGSRTSTYSGSQSERSSSPRSPRNDLILSPSDRPCGPDPHLLCMLFRAAFKAVSGLARPLVASSKAAFIELQNFPIWGILGITIPFRTFS